MVKVILPVPLNMEPLTGIVVVGWKSNEAPSSSTTYEKIYDEETCVVTPLSLVKAPKAYFGDEES